MQNYRLVLQLYLRVEFALVVACQLLIKNVIPVTRALFENYKFSIQT